MRRSSRQVVSHSFLEAALEGLQLQRSRIEEQIGQVRAMLGQGQRPAAAKGAKPAPAKPARKPLSAAARRRIAAAQKKRWAAYRKQQAAAAQK